MAPSLPFHAGFSSEENWTLGRGWEIRPLSYYCTLSGAGPGTCAVLLTHSLDTAIMFMGSSRTEVFPGLFSLY